MSDPRAPDPTRPLPPERGGALHGRGSERAVLIAASLLLIGGGLAYATLFRQWAYHPITPSDLSTLSSADRPFLTVSWWDDTNTCCGPFPAVWPALALLCAVPLLVAAIRRRRAARLWGTFGLLSAFFGATGVLVAEVGILERGWNSDSGWVYSPDLGTVAMAMSGYALLALGVLVLRRTTPSTPASTRPTPSVGG